MLSLFFTYFVNGIQRISWGQATCNGRREVPCSFVRACEDISIPEGSIILVNGAEGIYVHLLATVLHCVITSWGPCAALKKRVKVFCWRILPR